MNKYQIIYADPPWRYDFSKDSADKIERHYPTMSVEEIGALTIPADENCVLFLWATAPKLLEALEVMKLWGFQYKTHAVWDKEWVGMGYWFRGRHELLLVGTRGKISPPATEYRIDSVVRARRGEHSKKPIHFVEMINRAYPNYLKLEMFSRCGTDLFGKPPGWDVWGNEI